MISDSAMEHPLCKVPYEDTKRAFRMGQKHIEREFAEMKKALKEEDSLVTEKIAERVNELSAKLSILYDSTTAPTLSTLHARIGHLHSGETSETQLTRWLVDWALREGKENTAQVLADSSPLVDIQLFTLMSSILSSLRQRDCTSALAFARRHRLSNLEFELRLQELTELCRERRTEEAVFYSRKWVSPFYMDGDTDDAVEKRRRIERTMALVAYPPNVVAVQAYNKLYSPARWDFLQHLFRKSVYDMYALPHEPILWLAMYAGLVALKHPIEMEKNLDCPVCPPTSPSLAGGLETLAAHVPSSHHPHSVIVCRLSGKITHDPLAFPNGRVYGKEALQEMANKNGGRVRCPRTGMECSFTELRKVFIS